MHDETSYRLAIQGALVAAMAIWGLNVAVVKALTQSFDPPIAARRTDGRGICRIDGPCDAETQRLGRHFAGFPAVMDGTCLGIRRQAVGPVISP